MKIMIKDNYYRDLNKGDILEVKKWDSCMEETYGTGFVTLDGEKVINGKHCYIIEEPATDESKKNHDDYYVSDLNANYELFGLAIECNDGRISLFILEEMQII